MTEDDIQWPSISLDTFNDNPSAYMQIIFRWHCWHTTKLLVVPVQTLSPMMIYSKMMASLSTPHTKFLHVFCVLASSIYRIFPLIIKNPDIMINPRPQKILVLTSYPSSHHSRIHQSFLPPLSCLYLVWMNHLKSNDLGNYNLFEINMII